MANYQIELFCQSGSDYSIVDLNRKVWSIEDARHAYETGRVKNYNLAFKRLADLGWDVEKLKAHYAGGGR